MEGLLGKILIVDDDENICEVIKMYLETTGYNVKVAHDGKAAKEEFVNFSPNLVVLDMMLPGIDGMEVLKWIRKDSNVPVIMLTAKGETFDKVLALEIGADDYVVKPFEPKELLARVKAVMRRYSGEEPDNVVLNFPGLTIDANSYKVIYNGELHLKSLNFYTILQATRIKFSQEINYYVKFGDMITQVIQELLMFT